MIFLHILMVLMGIGKIDKSMFTCLSDTKYDVDWKDGKCSYMMNLNIR
jgi:hypothetical protein